MRLELDRGAVVRTKKRRVAARGRKEMGLELDRGAVVRTKKRRVAARGRKEMGLELDRGAVVRTKKRRVGVFVNKSTRCPACLIRKRRSRVASTKKSRRNSASPIKMKRMIQGEKEEAEKPLAPPSRQKKRKLDEQVLLDERKDKAAGLQKKTVLKEEREEEMEHDAPPPKKKKKKHQEKVAVNGTREVVEEHDEPLKTEKKKHQNKTSWCLYLQKLGFQERKSKMKTAIGNFLNESSLSYKKIVLYPSRCSAYVELCCKEDLNKAFELDTRKIFGQAVKLNKVEKLGALTEGDRGTLCIKSLPSEISAKNLKKRLEQVTGVWIQENQKNCKRSALVAFKTGEDADDALSKCEIQCKGNQIRLQPVHQKSKEKKKILKVTNLCPLNKTFLKSLFADAENVRIAGENDGQSQRTVYVEYVTAKRAKAALKQFQDNGVQGQAVRVASPAEGEERPEKRLLQEGTRKRGAGKTAGMKKKENPERRLCEKKKKGKRRKADLSPPSNNLSVWSLSPKAKLGKPRSTFKGSVGAEIPSSKRPCV
ncbi:uncharacterized protein LOC144609546 isoform X2 [Rhinoraja longicauda]